MANLSSKWAISDFRNIDSNLQSNSYFSFSKLSSPYVDKNNFQSSSILSDKLTTNNFKILHQNKCGKYHKSDEFLISLAETSPHVLCLTEHHLWTDELKNINLGHYTLGSQYCRQSHKQGGVSIFVSNNIQFHTINLDHLNKEKDLEICALKIGLPQENLIIICIYRSPLGILNIL